MFEMILFAYSTSLEMVERYIIQMLSAYYSPKDVKLIEVFDLYQLGNFVTEISILVK